MNADQWLTEYLAEHGPSPSVDVKRAGAIAGYSRRTLQRAMQRVGWITGKGPATRWALSVTMNRATTAPEPSQEGYQPQPDGPEPTGPSCPTCSHRWPVQRFPEPMPWWCPFDGTRYGGS